MAFIMGFAHNKTKGVFDMNTKSTKGNSLYVLIAAIITVIALTIICHDTANANNGMDYYAYAESLDLIEIIDSPDLTMEMLEARNGKLIIERAVGVVTDIETGDGYLIGYPEFYISYEQLVSENENVQNGNVVCSYIVYNPDNNYCDDIIMRFDYLIDAKSET